jgi:regulatory protein YycI of two-component signal transduction system YycFG
MNFSRAKSYLIVVFVIVNLFLVYNLVSMSSSDRISPDTIENTIEILNKKNIKLDKSLIKTTPETMFYLNLKNPFSDEEFLSNFKGNCTVSEEGFRFVPENKSIDFKYLLPSYDAAKQALSHFKDYGLEAKYTKCVGTLDMGEGVYKASFIQSFEGHDIYNTNIDIFYKEGSILESYGVYYEISSFSAPDENIKTQAEILIRFANDFNEKCTIKSIESGYFTEPFKNEYSMISAVPCFMITIDNGNKYYYDAISASLLKIDEF